MLFTTQLCPLIRLHCSLLFIKSKLKFYKHLYFTNTMNRIHRLCDKCWFEVNFFIQSHMHYKNKHKKHDVRVLLWFIRLNPPRVKWIMLWPFEMLTSSRLIVQYVEPIQISSVVQFVEPGNFQQQHCYVNKTLILFS